MLVHIFMYKKKNKAPDPERHPYTHMSSYHVPTTQGFNQFDTY